MTISCPHCQAPLDVSDDAPATDVLCPSCGQAVSRTTLSTLVPTGPQVLRVVGRFECHQLLGQGAFGEVWRARDRELGVDRAVKIPRPGVLGGPDDEKRFLREARAAASLKHAGIITVHEVGHDDESNTAYIVSDYIRGVNLAEWLTGRRPEFREAAELAAEIADALDFAHRHGVIHRDLKPGNIMLEMVEGRGLRVEGRGPRVEGKTPDDVRRGGHVRRGADDVRRGSPDPAAAATEGLRRSATPHANAGDLRSAGVARSETGHNKAAGHDKATQNKAGSTVDDAHSGAGSQRAGAAQRAKLRPVIMDFGLARHDAAEATTMTAEGALLGTPAYMSPEQAAGQAHRVDARSDVYSLGVILFELLTGERPFRGVDRMILHQVLNDDPPPPRRLNHQIPRDLETITLKCLSKEPTRRYATAADLRDDLRRWLSNEPILARPVGRIERMWRWTKRKPAAAIAIAAIVIGLVSVSVVSMALWQTNQKLTLANERITGQIRQIGEQNQSLEKTNTNLEKANTDLQMAEQLALSVSCERLGDAELQSGLVTDALRFYRQALEIRQQLAAADPSDAQARRRLIISYSKLGDAQRRSGQVIEALGSYQKGLHVLQSLKAQNRLGPEYEKFIEMVEQNIEECQKLQEETGKQQE